MSPAQIASLFKGKTLSQSGTRNEQGPGFGLLLVHDFVQQVNGHIIIESGLGKGTVISIDLPCR